MINVVCFWFRNWCGHYGPFYISSLYESIKKHTTTPFKFICFTDQPNKVSVPSIKFVPKYKWNLNKFIVFNPKYDLLGKVLTLDLDIVILKNINDIINFKEEFITCEAAYRKNTAGGSIVGTTINYGRKNIWQPLIENTEEITLKTGGSERMFYRLYLNNIEFFQHKYSGIYSYKRDVAGDQIKKDTRILRWHGKPRPHETKLFKKLKL